MIRKSVFFSLSNSDYSSYFVLICVSRLTRIIMLDTTRFAYYIPKLSFSFEHDLRTRFQRLHLRARSIFCSFQSMSLYPLTANDVPSIFIEPFIVRGYRAVCQPWSYYWKSLFHKHNETINVWSHLSGILYMSYLTYCYNDQFKFKENSHSWPFAVSLCTSILMFLCSALAHLLHSKSESIHLTCFAIDYIGVSLHGFGSGFLHIYYSSPQWYYNKIEYQYMFILLLLAIAACFSNCFAQNYFSRPYPPVKRVVQFLPCGILWIYSVIPLIIGVFPLEFPLDSGAVFHLGQICLFLLGGMVFAFDFPQRFYPGAFDFLGQGHHLFHLCIYLVTICQMHGVFRDYEKYRTIIDSRTKPDLIFCAGSMLSLVLWNIVIVCALRRWFHEKHHVHTN